MTGDDLELAKIGAEAAMKPFANLAERLFGGAVDQIGGAWEDRFRARREIRRIKLLKKVQEQLDKAGIDPNQISDSLSVPLVHEALLQDDEALQCKWASLLANASDPRQIAPVSTSFAAILKEFTGREVRFLDTFYDLVLARSQWNAGAQGLTEVHFNDHDLLSLYASSGLSYWPKLSSITIKEYKENKAEIDADRSGFALMMDLLKRNRVISEVADPKPIDVGGLLGNRRARVPVTVEIEIKSRYFITELGVSFVKACRAPS